MPPRQLTQVRVARIVDWASRAHGMLFALRPFVLAACHPKREQQVAELLAEWSDQRHSQLLVFTPQVDELKKYP